jgi:hypothetical protein
MSEEEPQLSSNLKSGRERFLSLVIQHGLATGRRTSEDFVRHFPPQVIMEGLRDRASLRAKIIVPTVGTRQRVALKKSWQSAADDLDISLAEGETEAKAVVELFAPDDRVTYLEPTELWDYITEGDFWNTSGKDGKLAQGHVAFMLSQGLEEKLITHEDVVGGLTVAELSVRLSKDALGRIIEEALRRGKTGAAFTELDLLQALPPEELVTFVPLPHIWKSVIEPKIAVEHGYMQRTADEGAEEPRSGPQLSEPPAAEGEPSDDERWTSAPPSASTAGISEDEINALDDDDDDLTDDDFDDEVVEAS